MQACNQLPQAHKLFSQDKELLVCPSLGGSLVGLRWGKDEILRPVSDEILAGVNGRACSSFPLIPFSNRIKDSRLNWRGRIFEIENNFLGYPHSIHGNGWSSPWAVVRRDDSSIELELKYCPLKSGVPEWPFPYLAKQNIELSNESLIIGVTVQNLASVDAPIGIGLHPYFAKTVKSEIQFFAKYFWETDEHVFPINRKEVKKDFEFLAPKVIGELSVDNCFDDWDKEVCLAWPEWGKGVIIKADGVFEHLILCTSPENRYIAIEPVSHPPNSFNSGFHDKSTVAPGSTIYGSMKIAFI
jgi:aldose 1-epimerase